MKSIVVSLLILWPLTGCAIIVGTHPWFERKEPTLAQKARGDLRCAQGDIQFVSTAHDDWREVEAHGCDRAVQYRYIRVGPVENWARWE